MKENDSLSISKVKAKIAQLRAEADKLEESLEFLIAVNADKKTSTESKHKGGRTAATVSRNLFGQPIPRYRDMSTKDGAIDYLRRKGKPAGATEISLALRDGGKQTDSPQFNRTVDNTLAAAAKRKSAVLEKIDGEWALKEWRNPATKIVEDREKES
jgi:hypothetical protein